MTEWPPDPGLLSFDEVSAQVIDFLKASVPMGFWSVSRHLDGRQVYLQVSDDVYGRAPGGSHAWSDSFCQYAVTGRAPQIAPRAMDVPEYAEAGVAKVLSIGSYIGIPIPGGEGEVFGTLCGLDPAPQPEDLARHKPMLDLLAILLGQIHIADRLRGDAIEREAKLRWRAFHDPLTGLANRALFRDRLNHATDLQRRDLRTISVLLLDLDRFKDVNDQLGHSAGDLLLAEVAKRIRSCLRAGDTAARLGGDEFAVLIEDGGQAESVARKLVDALRVPFPIGDDEVIAGVSIGVAEVPPFAATTNPDAVLARADAAMYEAKRAGRNQYRVYVEDLSAGRRPA